MQNNSSWFSVPTTCTLLSERRKNVCILVDHSLVSFTNMLLTSNRKKSSAVEELAD